MNADPASERREEWLLPSRHLGKKVWLFDRVESTNSLAAALAHDSANEGLVILANQQTAGRGQPGRTWQCSSGAGVLMSVLLFPPPAIRRPVVLTAWAAVAVCETIRKTTGLQAKIKWPNDVLIQGKKVCGILIEQGRATVAGIGLNVTQSAVEFANAGIPGAGSLASCSGKTFEPRDVARALIQELDEEYAGIIAGCLKVLESRWKWHVGLLGKCVNVECAQAVHAGRLVDMTFAGLELETAMGETIHLIPETVQHVDMQTTQRLP